MVQPDIPMNDGGDIPIFDMNGFTLRHLTKVVLSTLRVYMKYAQVRIQLEPSITVIVNYIEPRGRWDQVA